MFLTVMSVLNARAAGSRLCHGLLCMSRKQQNITGPISSCRFSLLTPLSGSLGLCRSQPWTGIPSSSYSVSSRCLHVPYQRQLCTASRSHVTSSPYSSRFYTIQASTGAQTTLFKKKHVKKRKKTEEILEEDIEAYSVTAYATCEELDLEGLLTDIYKQGLYNTRAMPTDVDDTMHVEAAYTVNDEKREIFFFREGGVVFWNVPDRKERDNILELMRHHQKDSFNLRLIQEEADHFPYRYTETEDTKLVNGEILLKVPGNEIEEEKTHQLEKYAFSNAVSLSVKLAMWEATLEQFISEIQWVVGDMKEGKELGINRKQVRKKTGELFMLRHLVNLESDLLLPPDFYWDREHLEPLYLNMFQHLNIPRRTKVINEKLEDCNKLTDVITDELNHTHSSKLEWYIIILIIIEVIFEVIHLMERYVGENPEVHKEELEVDLRYRDD